MTKGQFCDKVMKAFTDNEWTIDNHAPGLVGKCGRKEFTVCWLSIGEYPEMNTMSFVFETPFGCADDEYAIALYKKFLSDIYEVSREYREILSEKTWNKLRENIDKIYNLIKPIYDRYMQQPDCDEDEDEDLQIELIDETEIL